MSQLLRSLQRAHRRAVAHPERGTTLVEVVVAMTIMTICGAIFTGAMVTLFRVNNAAQAVNDSAQQVNQSYQSLDKLVRYASAVSTPGVATSGNWYVELSSNASGAEVCTQLRIDQSTQVLQKRTWTVTSGGTASPAVPAWQAVASNLTNGGAAAGSNDQPFVVLGSSGQPTAWQSPPASANHVQLAFTLITQSGLASDRKTSRSAFALAALNSSTAAADGSICQQVGRP